MDKKFYFVVFRNFVNTALYGYPFDYDCIDCPLVELNDGFVSEICFVDFKDTNS